MTPRRRFAMTSRPIRDRVRSRPMACAGTTMSLGRRLMSMALAPLLLAAGEHDAHVSLKEVSQALADATPAQPADFAGRDLSYLDLSGLDLARANLAGADLHGADLTDANLSRADLAGADLDHTVVIRTDFSAADLSNASLRGLAAYSTLEVSAAEAPNFAGAKLSGAHILARLGRANLHGADLSGLVSVGVAAAVYWTGRRVKLS